MIARTRAERFGLVLLGLVACGGARGPLTAEPASPPPSAADAITPADATATPGGGGSGHVLTAGPCPRLALKRSRPASPPGGRLASGGLECPPGLVEIPGGRRRAQTQGYSENSRGERVERKEVLVEQPAFCLGRTEVTRGAVTPGEPHPDAELPAELAYSEAKAYCEARGLRLPTQDEWRYAAVEASDFLFPWGDELPPDGVCWLLGPASKPCMVGRSARDVTPEGIHDMAANVREWVHVPAHVEPGEPWIPYDMIGEAHDTTCSELSLGGKLRLKGGGSNVAPQERAGFRCASSGRLRPGAGEAPR